MKTIEITYTSSGGRVFNLKAAPIHIKAANFHNYAWKRETVTLQYGERLVDFSKKAQVYQTTLYLDQDPEALAALHAAWERDVFLKTPGRLTWNGQYIECYTASSSTYPTEGNAYIANEIEIYCPNPFWIRETSYFLEAYDTGEPYAYLAYPHEYAYDFGRPPGGALLLWGEETGMVSFRAAMSGPAVNPSIAIGGRTFGASVTLEEGETLIIDTRPTALMGEQVYLMSGGTRTNLFHLRSGLIEPFPAEYNGVAAWSGLYPIELTVYLGRSEPSWN